MHFEDITPFVRQALIGNLTKRHTDDVRTKIKAVDCRMFYIISGSGKMIIDGTEYGLFPGTLIIFSAGTEYVWEIDDIKFYSVNFDYTMNFSHIKTTFHPIHSSVFEDKQIIERVHFDNMDILNSPLIIENSPMLERTMKQILTEYCVSGVYADLLLSSLLKSVIITAVRLVNPEIGLTREQYSAPLVRQIVEYINTHYESPVSNEDIAKHFNFNSGYLNRIFKIHTGSSIHIFLISRRLAAAMEMLRSQSVPVSEVAQKCGFQSLHHFTKTFKKHTNMTPSEYRYFNA